MPIHHDADDRPPGRSDARARGEVTNSPEAEGGPPREASPPTPAWRRVVGWLERLVTLALLAFVAVRLGPQLGALVGVGPTLGTAPDFSFVTLDGDSVHSADLRGSVVVVNFWATWCGPCRLEMPALQELHERSREDGVVVVGLSTDVGGVDGVRSFLAERGISYDVGMASAEHRRAFGGIRGIPTTFLVDRRGVIRHRVLGYFAPPALAAAVGRLVDESP